MKLIGIRDQTSSGQNDVVFTMAHCPFGYNRSQSLPMLIPIRPSLLPLRKRWVQNLSDPSQLGNITNASLKEAEEPTTNNQGH